MKIKYALFLLLFACSVALANFGTGTPSGPASSYNQINGNQKTRITDGTDTADVTATGELKVSVSGAVASITDPVEVTDGAGPLTVDGTVAATQSGSWIIDSVTNPVAVTGTFWQATQPVSGTVAATQSGTWQVQVTDGTDVADIKAVNVQVVGTDKGVVTNSVIHGLSTGGGGTYVDVKVSPSGALAADVSGSTLGANSGVDIGDVTINNAAGASAVNIQDGGNSITVDGTVAVTGAGDATAANQVTGNASLSSIDGKLPALSGGRIPVSLPPGGSGLTDTELRASPVPVSLTSTTITGTVAATQSGTWDEVGINDSGNSITVDGTVAATQSGTWTVQSTGNAGAAFDAANNGTAPANVVVAGIQLRDTTTATAGTVGQVGSPVGSLDHVLYVRNAGPVIWSCGLSGIGTTLTQCQAAPGSGLSLYVTDIIHQSSTATSGLWTLRYGTGANCGTGTGNIFFNSASALLANGANTLGQTVKTFQTPIKIPANNALCVLGVVTNTTNITINGFTAP